LRRDFDAPERINVEPKLIGGESARNIDLNRPGSEAQSDKWQKLYYRGLAPDSAPAAAEIHRTRLRLKPFKAPPR